MSEIYVFGPNDETNDYSSFGLVGALLATEATFTEAGNGDSSVSITCPLDEFGRYAALVKGNILLCPVPVRTTPEIQNGSCVTTVWTYKVKPLNQLTNKKQCTLYKKQKGSSRLKILNAGDIVTVVLKPTDSSGSEVRWKVKCKYGTGWIIPDGFELVTENVIGNNANAIQEVESPWTVKAQRFRIYEIEKTIDEVTVQARHISYDLLYNLTTYKSNESVTLQTALNGVLNNCINKNHGFTAYTNVANEQAGLAYNGKNPIDAMLDPEEGICAKYKVNLIRDNDELFFLNDPGMNRGVKISYGKNMTGVSYTVSDDNVATRIFPVGENKDGTPLYLSDTESERYIDSTRINNYPVVHAYYLTCDNCKVGQKDSNGSKVTVAVARARMKKQAEDLLSTGVDLPTIKMEVEYVNLGDTEEYAQFRNLENCFLYDYLIIQHGKQDINVTAQIQEIEWDILTDMMKSVTIGSVGETLANMGITTWQIPAGFSGGKIAPGTVGGGALRENAISTRHLQADSINASVIAAHSITADRLDATTVNAMTIEAVSAKINELVAGQITTDQLYVDLATIAKAQITAANIDEANIDWATINTLSAQIATIAKAEIAKADITIAQIDGLEAKIAEITIAEISKATIHSAQIDDLEATTAEIVNAKIANAEIDGAQIKDATIETAKIALGAITAALIKTGAVGTAQIADASITEAKIVSLNADAITAGTLSVDRLLIKGPNGLFRAINATDEGLTVEELSEEQYQNGMSGTVIVAQSITADKIAAKSITANEILGNTITAAEINVANLFADEATIAALDTYLLKTSTIEALEGKLDIWASDKITLAVKDVKIGGTNLLRCTSDMSASGDVGFHYDSSGADSMGTAVRQNDGSMLITNQNSNLRVVHSKLNVTSGEIYTVSAEYKDVSGECPHQFQIVSSSDADDMIQNAISEGDKTALADGWVRSVFTFTIPEGATYITPFFRSGTDYTLYSHIYYIRHPKLEHGNKDTDWSPNPSDMEARMATAESTITQQANEIAARVTQTTYDAGMADKADKSDVDNLTTRVSTAESTLTQQAGEIEARVTQVDYNAGMAGKANVSDLNALSGRVTTAETQITQNANAITSKASQSDMDAIGNRVTAAESEIQQTPSRISAAVSAVQVGGTNLVTLGNQSLVNAGGSAAEYIGKDWYRESEHQTTISPYSGVCWLQCPGVLITAGRKYTLSYYAWIQPGATVGAVKFRPNLFSATSDTDKYPTGFIPFVIGTPTKYAVTFDTTGWATGTYVLRFVMMEGQTHEVYFTDVKLEEGTKATAWSPNPNEIRIGTNILFDLYHTKLTTPYFEVDVSGENGDFKADENGLSANVGTFKTLNCPDVVKSTGSAIYSGGLQETFDALNGRFLTGDVTISLSADQYGMFVLKGVYGVAASVSIVGNGHSINGALTVYNCKLVNINIGGVTINGNGSSTPLALMDAGFVSVSGVTINGGGAETAVDANYGTRLMMYDNGLYNASNLIRLGHCTEGSLVQLRGGTCTNYLRADGARWTMSGTRPDGTYAQENTCLHAPENPDSLTIDYGTSQPPVTPVTTVSFTANVTGTYYPSGHWINSDNYIRQGFEGKTSTRKDYGCMWFNAGALAGKTIKSAMLTLTRRSGKGRSSSVTVTLWTTTLTGKSGKPTDTMASLGEIGKIQNGETATFSIPTSAISVIAAGGGLVTYTGETANAANKDYSPNYAHFYGVDTDGPAPVLTVTYQ